MSEMLEQLRQTSESAAQDQSGTTDFLVGAAGNQSRAKLYAALAKAQGEFPEIAKNRAVEIQMKSGGKFRFRYADLQAIIAATKPALSKHGLAVIQMIGDGPDKTTVLTTMLVHEGGGVVERAKTLPTPQDNDPKTLGALLTYFRRYMYSAAVGVSADDDLDDRDTKEEPVDLTDELVAEMTAAANGGTESYKKWWVAQTDKRRGELKALHAGMKKIAAEADKKLAEQKEAA